MRTWIALSLALTMLATPVVSQDRSAGETAPSKPRLQWTPEEFGVGRKHTANARCNRAIDKLLEENLVCYNARPADECETLLKKNSKKMGTYIKSSRCAK
jgi:hypothetical protein